MSKDSKKDELVERTLVFTLKNSKSLKYGTVINTETKGNETKLIFDTDKEYYEKQGKEIRSEGKGDFGAWIRSLETFPKLS